MSSSLPTTNSSSNLDLSLGRGASAGDDDDFPSSMLPQRFPRLPSVPAADFGSEYSCPDSPTSSSSSAPPLERRIVVANHLPLRCRRRRDAASAPATDGDDTDTTNPTSSVLSRFDISLDPDALVLQLKPGFPADTDTLYVGTLRGLDIDPSEQDDVSQRLFDQYRCVPVFLPTDIQSRFYHGFCKQYLWPLFHYMLPLSASHGSSGRFDRSLWRAYVSANKAFADRVMEVINPDDDYVWVHDYHLMALPTLLRRRANRVKLGFFLHSPFPSSEMYRTLPVREDILRSLLNADLIGFHTFDYARHFLSCCSRMLGLDYESKRGHVGLEYYGRTVTVKILPVGIDMTLMEAAMGSPETADRVGDLMERFKGKTLLLGVDDMDLFKGISLKFMAIGQLLDEHPEMRGKVVLVQIANPARSTGKDVQEAENEAHHVAKAINERYGLPSSSSSDNNDDDYQPIVFDTRSVSTHEKVAYYSVAECCIVNAVRDGMNLVPYKYTVCRQGSSALQGLPKKSVIVVSEFIGCSPSLSGAIRVNPWNVDAVAEAIYSAINMPEAEKQLRHEKHHKYIVSHDVTYWAKSFDQDLQRACRDHFIKRCWGIGFGLGFRVVALDPSFRKLSVEHIVSAYRRTKNRLILLDYDGTMMSQASVDMTPSENVISILKGLTEDPKNVVFVVSGRGREPLAKWFQPVEKLGISAEHGYFTRWSRNSPWESCLLTADYDWKAMAEPVMRLYTETTDGSSIEEKESALVWHHQDADPDFGSCQSKELLDHLENVLANEPVVVKRGQHIVEVKPQGVSKGRVVEDLISSLLSKGTALDFVLCIGDDRSDEDMFESLTVSVQNSSNKVNAEIFACTVGKKPSMAKYYLDDTAEVIKMLQGLANAYERRALSTYRQVSFEGFT